MKLIQVVRRYGPVGGMERYVWELTHELRNLGHEVLVLCEVCLADRPRGIVVHELGTIAPRPRWLALLRFGGRVARWLEEDPHPGWRSTPRTAGLASPHHLPWPAVRHGARYALVAQGLAARGDAVVPGAA
jgi:hypothetical protein